MPKKTALLIIDVQQALCVGANATFRAMATISNINQVINKAREANVTVIFIQHETDQGDFTRGSEGWHLSVELDRAPSDLVIAKSCSDAFKNTDLKRHLDTININRLVVCGMQSEFCVDSTIRRALALDYAITIVADGHTTVDNAIISASTISKHHNVTWQNISSYRESAKVINAAEIDFL